MAIRVTERAAGKRVNKNGFLLWETNQKVARKINAGRGNADPLRDREINQREGYGNAAPDRQHSIQVTVFSKPIMLGVADKLLLFG